MSIFENIKFFLPKLLLSSMVFLTFFMIATFYKQTIKKINHEKLIQYEIKLIFYYILIGVGALCSIIPLGIQPTTLLALFGSTGIAIALSLQGVLTNMVSGIYISMNNLFKLDDQISIVDSSGNHYTGKISSFNLFNTVITTDKNVNVIIPNTYIQNNMFQMI